MEISDSTHAHQIAQAATAFERQTTGRLPSSVTVVMSEDTLVITLHGTISPGEMALAKKPDGAAQLRELHQQLFSTASEPLRREVRRITGIVVRSATAEVDTSTGTVVHVFLLDDKVAAGAWSGKGPEVHS